MSTGSNSSDNESNFSGLDQPENQEESINAISETIASLLEQVSIPFSKVISFFCIY
jgi:hypothetical protein